MAGRVPASIGRPSLNWSPSRLVVVGASGTGKTWQAKRAVGRLLARRQAAGRPGRLIVFDPAGGPDGWWPVGACYVESRAEFLVALASGRYPIVVRGIWCEWAPLPVLWDLVVVVDEAAEFMTPHAVDPSIRAELCRGRHRRHDVIVCSQRARHLNPVVFSNVSGAIVLPITHGSDRDAVEAGLGVRLPAAHEWPAVPGHPTARLPYFWPGDWREGRLNPASFASVNRGPSCAK